MSSAVNGRSVLVALALLAAALGVGPRRATAAEPAFTVIVLGAQGGLREDDLSSYLLSPAGDRRGVALDAGTLLAGIRAAAAAGSFWDEPAGESPAADLDLPGRVLRDRIRAVLVSHAHLDHVAGLVLDSPDDAAKPILGLPATIDALRDHLFAAPIWSNFADEGSEPRIGRYHYVRLAPGTPTAVPGTTLSVEAWPLAHAGGLSTAFLLSSGGRQVLYFGDTGPDDVEKSHDLAAVWTRIAPLVRAGTLRAIFLESSYPNGRADDRLFGHLTPAWLLTELRRLAVAVDADHPTTALGGLTILVTHVKPSLARGPAPRDVVRRELDQGNDLGVRFVLPRQGDRIDL